MTEYQDVWYPSEDGLTLYARDYEHPKASLNLLCMHGLTRNSADFEALCDHLHPRYRLVVVDQRGRGRSEYDPVTSNYHPGTYVKDMFRLIEHLNLDNLVLIGTSLGGLMAMIMASLLPGKFKGVVLNDIGPVIEAEGISRIQGYVGKGLPVTNWDEAIAQARAINGAALIDYSEEDWWNFARKLYRENEEGVPVLNYDPAIAELMNNSQAKAVPPDLWFAFDALKNTPCLVVRGESSDILSKGCVEEMQRRKSDLQVVEIVNRGHAPMLDEPQALAAVDQFMQGVEKSVTKSLS
ncbi:MAG: alpha/beta hydrolase [Pseudomonadales bacterium]|nr:alpha/beta hydrolase [Pseudomonadales bacterium]